MNPQAVAKANVTKEKERKKKGARIGKELRIEKIYLNLKLAGHLFCFSPRDAFALIVSPYLEWLKLSLALEIRREFNSCATSSGLNLSASSSHS